MGIPRMLTRLKDANIAVTKELGRTGDQVHTRAIIDGPGFAHFVLQRLPPPQSANHTLVPDVKYADCARIASRWLRQLEAHGFTIEAIFFDGGLPESKKETRINRLCAHANKLGAYKRMHEAISRACRPELHDNGDAMLWSDEPLRQARRNIAPPPFLVSAVLEALLESEYADRTFVVPDEADRFCVAAARKACLDDSDLGVAIFSDDSDLFVFNSGEETRIIPFSDLHTHQEDGVTVVKGTEVWPAQTAKRLRCPDLIELAFHLSDDENMSVGECMVQMVPGEPPTHYDWQEFSTFYQLGYEPELLVNLRASRTDRQIRNGLDARVSEVVQQVIVPRDGAPEPIPMYLPFLLEDPTRASAWLIGTGLRRAAYEILLVAADRTVTRRLGFRAYGKCISITETKIEEFKRSGNRVYSSYIGRWDCETLGTRMDKWSDVLRRHLDQTTTAGGAEITVVERWRVLVMELMLIDFVHQSLIVPTPEEIVPVLTGQPGAQWHMVHLSAMYQATYYSLRILHQIMRYVQRVDDDTPEHTALREDPNCSFNVLLTQLEGLPGIADFFEVQSAVGQARAQAKWGPLLLALILRLDNKWQHPGQKLKRKARPKRAKVMPSVREEHKGVLAGNSFAALAAE